VPFSWEAPDSSKNPGPGGDATAASPVGDADKTPAKRPNKLIIQRNNWLVRENGSGAQISDRLRDHIANGNRIDPKPDYAFWKQIEKDQINTIRKTWTTKDEPPTD